MMLGLNRGVTNRLLCLRRQTTVAQLNNTASCYLTRPRIQERQSSASYSRYLSSYQHIAIQHQSQNRNKSAWPQALAGIAVLFAGGLAAFNAVYQQKAPYADRRRFVFYSDAEAAESEETTMAELQLTLLALEAVEKHPEEVWGEDHPVFGATRRILDRLLVGHGMDPAHWKLHIIDIPGNENVSAIVYGHFVMFSGVFYSFEAEEAIATLMTNALSNNTCNYQAEVQSYRLFKTLSLVSATNLFVTSFFARKLWFVTVPYMAWWAWYKFSGEGKCQKMMEEIDHNGLTALFKAGINPGWAPLVWLAYAQGLVEASHEIEKDDSMKKELGSALQPLIENMRENAVSFVERSERMCVVMENDPSLKKAVEAQLGTAEMTPLPTFAKDLPASPEIQGEPPSDNSDSDNSDSFITPDS